VSSLDGATGFKLNGAAAYDFSGYSVASAGDVNGDGFADVIVGANGADSHSSGSGASFAANIDLSTLDGATGFKLSGAADSDFVGGSVASAGDVNGDASSRSPSPASMSRDLTKAAASASAGAAVMIRRVARLRRGLLYAHVRHDLSTASRIVDYRDQHG
jgi:hypothetical protein